MMISIPPDISLLSMDRGLWLIEIVCYKVICFPCNFLLIHSGELSFFHHNISIYNRIIHVAL